MSEGWIRAVVLVCTFGAVLLAVEVLGSWLAARRVGARAVNERLKLIGQGRSRAETFNLLRRSAGQDLAQTLPVPLGRLTLWIDRLLMGARVRVPLGRALIFLFAAPLASFLFIVFLVFSAQGGVSFGQLLMIAVFSGVLGSLLPVMVLQMKATRTRKKMQDQFPVALDVFVRGLRAGHPIASALELLTVEMTDPVGSEFGLVVDEVTYGADLRDALSAMAERWDMDDIRMFVVSLSVQSETGGNLAEILENLSKVIRERASMMMKVRALSSEGRMTAVMLSILPVLTFVMVFLMTPSFYMEVADDPMFVPSFLALILMYFIGVMTIRRMVDLKV